MIRNKTIFAEPNSPDTVLTTEILANEKYIVASGNRNVVNVELEHGILVTDENGQSKSLVLDANDNQNKLLVTDENGDLKWIGG